MRRVGLAVIIGAAMIGPAAADAMTREQAAVVAVSYWRQLDGVPICRDGVRWLAQAEATWPWSPDSAAYAPVGFSCDVYLADGWESWWAEALCTIVVHELGHSGTGRDHSPPMTDVMSPVPMEPGACSTAIHPPHGAGHAMMRQLKAGRRHGGVSQRHPEPASPSRRLR